MTVFRERSTQDRVLLERITSFRGVYEESIKSSSVEAYILSYRLSTMAPLAVAMRADMYCECKGVRTSDGCHDLLILSHNKFPCSDLGSTL